MCHLDRSDREAAAQWRDLRFPATEPKAEPTPTTTTKLRHHNQSDRAAVAQHLPLPPTELTHLLTQIHRLRRADIDYLQIREKDLSPADLHTLAAALRRLIPPGQRPRLLLNLGHDHSTTLAIALALRLDGLHLPANTPPHLPAELRAAFARACRSTPILSISAHTLAEVAAARAANLDLILFGPVFGKTVFGKTVFPQTNPTHATGQLVTPALGLDLLAEATRLAHPIPVLALGGLTPANTPAALATGAAGIAGIRLFL